MAKKKETKSSERRPVLPTWTFVLQSFDPEHFNYGPDNEGRKPKNLKEAARCLATWFYDNTKAGSLKKMMTKLPEELWVLALKNWRDGHHDT